MFYLLHLFELSYIHISLKFQSLILSQLLNVRQMVVTPQCLGSPCHSHRPMVPFSFPLVWITLDVQRGV